MKKLHVVYRHKKHEHISFFKVNRQVQNTTWFFYATLPVMMYVIIIPFRIKRNMQLVSCSSSLQSRVLHCMEYQVMMMFSKTILFFIAIKDISALWFVQLIFYRLVTCKCLYQIAYRTYTCIYFYSYLLKWSLKNKSTILNAGKSWLSPGTWLWPRTYNSVHLYSPSIPKVQKHSAKGRLLKKYDRKLQTATLSTAFNHW